MEIKKKLWQLQLLFKKNWILQKRKPIITLIEVLIPVLLSVIVVLIRGSVHNRPQNNPKTWSSFHVKDFPPPRLGSKWWSFRPCRLAYYPDKPWAKEIVKSFMRENDFQVQITEIQAFSSVKNLTDAILEKFNEENNIHNNTVQRFLRSKKYEMSYIARMNSKCSYLGGIILEKPKNSSIKVTIKLSSTPRNANIRHYVNPFKDNSNWHTQFTLPLFQIIGPREANISTGGIPGYWSEGFLTLQWYLTRAILKYSCKNDKECLKRFDKLKKVDLKLNRTPYPPFDDDNFVIVLQQYFPMVIMLSFVFIALNIVKDVVQEKEERLKEAMKIMGLNGWMHWIAWFAKYLLFMLASVALMTILFCVKASRQGKVVGYTSSAVMFFFLLMYSIMTICFAFCVSVFFSKSNPGAAGAGIIFVITYIPYFYIQQVYDTLSMSSKLAACLLPNIAMSLGCQVIGMFEGTGSGVHWDNIFSGVSVDDDFSLLHTILMMILDSVICLIIMWYVEAVWPGDFGVPQPFYFPFQKSYWCGSLPTIVEAPSRDVVNETFYEREPGLLRIGLQVKNLKKIFKKGKSEKVAVDGLSLNMFEGQITALLGQNGAGKTTTMSMLTGFLPPTSGTAKVNGYDIVTQMPQVRSSLGYCPQHNILFPTLTVEEHLSFFARLKGCPASQTKAEIEKYLDSIDLRDKRKCLAKTLSGGQKRKLSISIALIAQSKVVILDEPTAGMDATARRQLWDILLNNRLNRTILMSTHMMDEADILGDRIAIIAEGTLQCCGSGVFLKSRYGTGYHLNILKNADSDVDEITKVIMKHVPSARFEMEAAAGLSYLLPKENSNNFQNLFLELEYEKEKLSISGLGVSVTTMEEVFFRVKQITDEERQIKYDNLSLNESKDSDIDSGAPSLASTADITLSSGLFDRSYGNQSLHNNVGWRLFFQQLYAMLVKKFLQTSRNLIVTSSQMILPIFFTTLGLGIVRMIPSVSYSPPLNLDLSKYMKTEIPFIDNNINGVMVSIVQAKGVNTLAKNITNYKGNMSQFLIYQGERSLATYNSKYMFALTDQKKSSILAYFNNQAFHTPAVILSIIANGFLNFVNGTLNHIDFVNYPLPRTVQQKLKDEQTLQITGFIIGFEVVFGMSFLAASFSLFLIRERATGSKHLQLVSGVRKTTYWLATFIWDYLIFILPCCCLFITFALFNILDYTDKFQNVLLLLLLYGWAMLPSMYVWSFMFSTPSTGYVWLTLLNILSGEVTVLVVDIMSIPQLDVLQTARVLKWIFITFFPNYNLGQGMQQLYLNYETDSVCQKYFKKFDKRLVCFEYPTSQCCPGCTSSCWMKNYLAWEENGIGKQLTFLALQGIAYFTVLMIMETGLWRRFKPILFCESRRKSMIYNQMSMSSSISSNTEDENIAIERNKVRSIDPSLYGVVLSELTKCYDDLLAVDSINLAIEESECFGLLGVNGAGKTSTFKMITGDEGISSGDAFLAGYNLKTDMQNARRMIGYCPQFDALIDQMTGREMLTMIGRLRGVPEGQLTSVVNDQISAVLLQNFANKRCGEYSGGNKRKLSTGMALIGDPPVILLDEPTAGMDPVARRSLWNTLNRIRTSGRSLILTSHSMDECEALCTRLAIMVNGQFRCLGSTQELKCKFGQGFTVIMKLSPPSQANHTSCPIRAVIDFIDKTWPGSTLIDSHEDMVHYNIPATVAKWSQLFGIIERERLRLRIEDYIVSQTTLEQVFLNLTKYQRSQEEGKGVKKRMNCFSWCNCCVCYGQLEVHDDGQETNLL
ncbi:DgyrCDS4339 [Dimorphilus gyrociliatus]|uniref:DgyrCDS4339 n=1 Tax=Dimorphilus gyrociliatus TaxID=2664684 RepID=A0A7I8VI71_9ANNE|nr:DgyrCDS4339 [Dimorphilus gyrociliatus]